MAKDKKPDVAVSQLATTLAHLRAAAEAVQGELDGITRADDPSAALAEARQDVGAFLQDVRFADLGGPFASKAVRLVALEATAAVAVIGVRLAAVIDAQSLAAAQRQREAEAEVAARREAERQALADSAAGQRVAELEAAAKRKNDLLRELLAA